MRIALDASYSVGPALSGVGVYCARLIEELIAAAPESEFILCYRMNRFFRSLWRPRPGANARRRLMQEPLNFVLPRRVELFHGLNQRLPGYRFRRAVTTFHDLFVMTGEYSTPDFRARFTALAREAAIRSDRIIAVSRHTAEQVTSLLGVEPSRLRVIHHGVDPIPAFSLDDLAAFRRRYQLDRPFLLHVGAIQARKNVARLVEAFERLSPNYDLVLAGSDGYGAPEIHQRIAASKAAKRIRALGYVERQVVERLYRTAAVLAFPSLDEGFGMPVLEAMSAGLPAVTSDRSGLVEAAGDAALLVDPTDTEAMTVALRRALEDTNLRADIVNRGRQRAAQFTWKRAAAETLEVYRNLL